MAELSSGGDGGKGGKKRAKKQSTRVDMTPLVDLAFLLLTFFVLTSTFSKPKVLRMIFPEKLKDPINQKAPEVKNGLTILLVENNRIFYYNGALDKTTVLLETDYTKDGIRKVLIERNAAMIKQLLEYQKELEKIPTADTAGKNKVLAKVKDAQRKSTLNVIVKTDDKASYRNMIDMMDELLITQVAKYYPVDEGFMALEKTLVQSKIKSE
jgi:biopolymer transport protein ExbD